MSERSVVVRLKAEISDFRRQMDAARRSVKDVGDETEKQSKKATTTLGRLVESADKNQQSWDQAGTALVAFGTATVGALGLATKAAIDWESAFAGVRKTVDGSDAEIAALEDELRELARTLPATHAEIAATAEAAGQLGVAREDIASFTRTMVDLGETTNLSADEAATSIAQMMNVMQTAPQDVGRLGATLVELGNNGASTERQIIQMSQRISGAAAVVGLAESDVLALANTVASMGIEVEAGGTAVSRVLTDMGKAAATGAEELEVFARVAGMSAQDFATAFREDPAEAFATFIDGLAGIQAAGGDVFSTLDDLGLADVRVSQALLGMSSAGDLLRESLELGAQAWADNTALAEEAGKRYDTTAAKVQIAKNNVRDAAIEFGEVLVPAVAAASEQIADLAQWLGALPPEAQGAIVGIGALTGGASLLVGAFLLAFPRVVSTINAFRDLAEISPRAAAGLGKVGKAAGIAGVILAVSIAAEQLVHSFGPVAPTVEAATQALLDMRDVSDLDALFADNAAGVDSFVAAADRMQAKNPFQAYGDVLLGAIGLQGRHLKQATDDVEALDRALAGMVEGGNTERAAEQHALLAERLREAGFSADQISELFPVYAEALAAVENEQTLAAGSAGELQVGMGGLVQTAEDAEAAMAAFSDELDRLLGATFSVDEAQDRWQEGINNLTAAVEANGTSLTGTTNEAIANRDAMRAQVEQGVDLLRTMAEQGASSDTLKGKAAELKRQLIEQAEAAGYDRDEVAKLAAAFDDVEGIYTATVQAQTGTAVAALDEVLSKVTRLDGRTATVTVTTRNVITGRQSTQTTRMEADGDLLLNRGGGLVAAFSDGGHFAGLPAIGAQQPQISPNRGPMGIMWAETGAGPWEAFISGHPAKRGRSIDIWERTGDMLGVRFQRFAGGGYMGAVAAPATAAAPQVASMEGLVLEGTLDLGGGLEGRMRAVVRSEQASSARAVASGRGSR